MKTGRKLYASFVWMLCLALLAGLYPPLAGLYPPLAGLYPPLAGRSAQAAPTTPGISPAGLLNPDGSLDLSSGFEGSLDLNGWQVTLDSQRGPLLAPAARDERTAISWDPSWSALPNQGLNGQVYALAVIGSWIYVGGSFDATSDGALTNLGNLARYHANSQAWHPISNQGLNGAVYALLEFNDDLIVGGTFSASGDGAFNNLGNLARYDPGMADWYPLPNQGLNGGVYALAVINNAEICAGGAFTATGDLSLTSLGNLAFYNTIANSWYAALNQGLNGVVRALAVAGNDLYVGGQFTALGDGSLTQLGNIARYHTVVPAGWQALPNKGLDGSVFALAVGAQEIFAGGAFWNSGDGLVGGLNMIARLNPVSNQWSELDHQGLNNYVYKLAVVGDDLYVGGSFSATADGVLSGLDRLARYDCYEQDWLPLPQSGLNGEVTALAVNNGSMYAGGAFTQSGDGTLTGLGHVVAYNFSPEAWHGIPADGLNGAVRALAILGSDLYLGGEFTASQDGSLNNLGYILRYDTLAGSWQALPQQGLNDPVLALAVIGNDLYAGGQFTASGDGTLTNLGHMARYDTLAGSWHKLPRNGLNGAVYALQTYGTHLYVGGFFSASGDGVLANLGNIARYDPLANSWQALSHRGLNNAVAALAATGNGLYVGGFFSALGDGSLANLGNIASYDPFTDSWQALAHQGLNSSVSALAGSGYYLYVGGAFNVSGDTAVANLNHIARYDTLAGTWQALPGQGLGGTVNTLAISDDELYVGGSFAASADGSLGDLGNVARFNLHTHSWRRLPNRGVNQSVHALAIGDGGVFAGGVFNGLRDGSLSSRALAHFGDRAWRPLRSQGLDSTVEALAVVAGKLYVGGSFSATGNGALTNLGGIACYDPASGTWSALPRQGLNGGVYALAAVGSDLYVGGWFTASGDGTLTGLGNIARYDTAGHSWSALPHQGLNDTVYALAVTGDGSQLYVGGNFTASGDGALTSLGGIARYNLAGNTWQALAHQGLNGSVAALASAGDDLYVGGAFYQTGDGSVGNLNYIARYDLNAQTWNALPRHGLDSYVYALAVMGSDLYVGGDFNQSADGALVDLESIVRYERATNTWQALPNLGLQGGYYGVTALVVLGSDLYVGGDFEKSGDETSNRLGGSARYDSLNDRWHPLPNQGLAGTTYALQILGNSLYAGGTFQHSGDDTLDQLGNIARLAVGPENSGLYLPLLVR